MPAPALSIVAPIHNEASILRELVARCAAAGRACAVPFEIVLVDDASTDGTPALLAALARDAPLKPCRLDRNAGQFRATQAGLRAAVGAMVVVLDGDLQDPPEHIPSLFAALSGAPEKTVAVLAVKASRDDPAAFMLGQFVFHRVQEALSRVSLPAGAGSYCIMRRAIADRVARADLRSANLAAMVGVAAVAERGELAAIPYAKGARYDSSTRVGWKGLIAEAIGSLAVTGALPRLLLLAAIVLAVGGSAADSPPVRPALCAAAVAAAAGSLWISRRVSRALAEVRSAPGPSRQPPPAAASPGRADADRSGP